MVKTLLLILCLSASVFSQAQVKWTGKLSKVDRGNYYSFTIELTAVVRQGEYMFAQSVDNDSLRLNIKDLSRRSRMEDIKTFESIGNKATLNGYQVYSGAVKLTTSVKVYNINNGEVWFKINYATSKDGKKFKSFEEETVIYKLGDVN